MIEEVLRSIDRAVNGRVLLFGSRPPDAHDIDLLARPAEFEATAAALTAMGFERKYDQWARFRDCTVDIVDLVPAEDWHLSDAELADVFDRAAPLQGYTNVVAGSVRRGERANTATARSLAGRLPGVRYWAARAGRSTRGHLITFSGLDGSGKSTQAEAVRDLAERAGREAVVVWTRLTFNPSLEVISKPVKRIIARRGRSAVPAEVQEPADPGREWRQRNRAATRAWVVVVALANAMARRRSIVPHLRKGHIVVADRAVLDSVVQLRVQYAEGRPLPLATALLRLLAPRATAAYFLDVDPTTARTRKPDDLDLVTATEQAALYRQEAARLGVTTVSGELPPTELCARIGREVWRAIE